MITSYVLALALSTAQPYVPPQASISIAYEPPENKGGHPVNRKGGGSR